jgi:hypothetical protein
LIKQRRYQAMWKAKGIKLAVVGLVILALLIGGGCKTNQPPTITSLIPSATSVGLGGSCTVTCTASDPEGTALTYAWSVTAGAITGTTSSVSWTAPETEGTCTITVTVSDEGGKTDTRSCDILVANAPPVIASLTPSATTVGAGSSCTVTCTASDPEGDALTYTWTCTAGAITGTGNSVSWTAPATEGTYTISVTVSDGKGGTASESCDILVANTSPVISSLTPSSTSVLPSGSCTVTCTASDPDGDTLTYAWTATGGAISGIGSAITWIAPTTEGTYTINVTVSDGKGGTDTDSCAITVEAIFGSIDIQSSPSGAAVFLDGEDTGNITPYTITNLAPGTYTLKLEYYHYKNRSATVTVSANETTYINWSLTYDSEETLTIQPDAAAGKDASVDTAYPTSNYGTNIRLAAGSGTADTCRAYLEFSLASLPADAVILSARVELYYYDTMGSSTVPIGAYRVTGAWDETTIVWDTTTPQPTSAATPEYSYLVPAAATNNWVSWIISNMVKGWWDGSIPNYGVVLKDTAENSDEAWKSFFSSDSDIAGQRPRLIIVYYDPTT